MASKSCPRSRPCAACRCGSHDGLDLSPAPLTLALSETDPASMVTAGLIGGTITAGTHFAKAGNRLAINTSPEPFSNWVASFGEEGIVLAGLWAMLESPLVFLVLLAVFMVLTVLAIHLFSRLLEGIFRRAIA